MAKTVEQYELSWDVIRESLTKMDWDCLASIPKIHEIARDNYAISIWTGVVARHANSIAKGTEGQVVVKTANQREDFARWLHDNFDHKAERR